MPLDRERIQQLLEVFKASQAGEFALQEGDRYYRFVRLAPASNGDAQIVVEAGDGTAPAVAVAPQAAPEPETVAVTARVVGLFYRGKQPGQEALVHVGDRVKAGQMLGLIEVLRKPTVVTSPVAGEVVEIVHEDGHGVQYGDPLFVIRPS